MINRAADIMYTLCNILYSILCRKQEVEVHQQEVDVHHILLLSLRCNHTTTYVKKNDVNNNVNEDNSTL